jgi:hypothetical protein
MIEENNNAWLQWTVDEDSHVWVVWEVSDIHSFSNLHIDPLQYHIMLALIRPSLGLGH